MNYTEYEAKVKKLNSEARQLHDRAEYLALECLAIYGIAPQKEYTEFIKQVMLIPLTTLQTIYNYYDTINRGQAVIPKSYFTTTHKHTHKLKRVPKELHPTLNRIQKTSIEGYPLAQFSLNQAIMTKKAVIRSQTTND